MDKLADSVLRIAAARGTEERLQAISDEARRLVGAHRAITSVTAPDGSQYSKASFSEQASRFPDWVPVDVPGIEGGRHGNWLAVPIVARSKAQLGLLQLWDKADGQFTQLDESLVSKLAEFAASFLELSQAQQIMQESEERFRTLADNIAQLAWMADETGYIFWFNKRWFDYTGTTHDQMAGWGWQKVQHPDFAGKVTQTYQAAIEAGRLWEETFPLRGADGQYRWFLTRAVPVQDDGGRVVRYFGTNTDVDDQRRAQEEREALLASERAARTEAERAIKLKDEFVATLSHELRTPLHSILGWVHMLKQYEPDAETLAQGLDVIERNARIQAQMVEDLLDMSRITSGKLRLDLETVDLCSCMQTSVSSIQPVAASKGVQLKSDLQKTDPVQGDLQRLQQIIANLLSNAVKFTPSGGEVRVSLDQQGNMARILVSDTGCGIKPDFLPNIFDRFRQADGSTTRKHGGLGLGLSIVKSLVDMHGGQVSASSPGENKGATFTLLLPVSSDVPAPETPVERVDLAPNVLDRLHVLVVDDDADARDLLSRILEERGARVSVAGSASEGLSLYRESRPDVIVSDISMPEQDGYDFMRQLGSLGPRPPALALTALARVEDRERALSAGFLTHLAKPVEPNELIALVAFLTGRN